MSSHFQSSAEARRKPICDKLSGSARTASGSSKFTFLRKLGSTSFDSSKSAPHFGAFDSSVASNWTENDSFISQSLSATFGERQMEDNQPKPISNSSLPTQTNPGVVHRNGISLPINAEVKYRRPVSPGFLLDSLQPPSCSRRLAEASKRIFGMGPNRPFNSVVLKCGIFVCKCNSELALLEAKTILQGEYLAKITWANRVEVRGLVSASISGVHTGIEVGITIFRDEDFGSCQLAINLNFERGVEFSNADFEWFCSDFQRRWKKFRTVERPHSKENMI